MGLPEGKLRGRLDLAVAQLGKKDIRSPDELLEVFAHQLLVGTKLAPDLAGFLKSYAQAELAGEDQRESFVKEVYGPMSDEAVEKPIAKSDLGLVDLVLLTHLALNRKDWSLGSKKNPNFDSLPLAV